ncbi:hypothetical protein EGJ55_14270 [Pseudomonas moraviensis]|nr:hypothetical protein EGJ55_14270 [Pseudomonas moraviensis]
MKPDDFDEGRRFYSPYPPVGLKESDLYYFALSLAWRACQGSWGEFEGIKVFTQSLELEVKEYLLGRAGPPPQIKVMVYVDWDGKLGQMLTLPHVDSGRMQIVLLGLCIEIHIDVEGQDIIVQSLNAMGQNVSLVLDKTRCAEVYELIVKEAMRLKFLKPGAWYST